MTPSILLAVVLAQAAILSFIMMGAWAVQQRTGNCGWIDAVWTFGLGLVGFASALLPLSSTGDITSRQWLVATLVAIWSLRLGWHIIERSAGKPDDPRYAKLMIEWGEDARRQMFVLLQKQALVTIPLAASIAIAAHNPTPALNWQDALAVAIFAIGVLGGAISDRQLRAFATDPANRNRACDAGFWRYSRHPNYFFEWLHWLSYPLVAISLAGSYSLGWLALAAPLCIYWLLVYVSGIPPLEEHMLRRLGPAYETYQKRTNAFFPWPRQNGSWS